MSSLPNPEFLRRAIALATQNVQTGKGGPFAAVIVRDGVIVGEGANTVTSTNDPTAHGEVNAMRAACKALGTFTFKGCELYTSCEPCPMCWAASYWAHIKTIYYGNRSEDAERIHFADAFLYVQLALPREKRVIPEHELLRQEAWESFQSWSDSTRKMEF
jgi:guanine deaminase